MEVSMHGKKILFIFLGLICSSFDLGASISILQLCLNGEIYNISTSDCKAGVWFPSSLKLHDVCFQRGIWAVYEAWCQEDPEIWTIQAPGNACIPREKLKKKIHGIVYLGSNKKGFVISTYKKRLFLSKRHQFVSIDSWNLEDPNVEVLIWGYWKRLVFLEHHKGGKNATKCFADQKIPKFRNYVVPLSALSNFSATVYETLSKCPAGNLKLKGKSPTNMHLFPAKGRNRKNEFLDHCAIGRNINPEDNFMEYTPEVADAIDQQTKRVVLKLVAADFQGEHFKFSHENFEEWTALEIGNKILQAVCPDHIVSKFLLEKVMLLFKLLLLESFRKYSPTLPTNEITYRNIKQALEACLEDAKPLQYHEQNFCSSKPNTGVYESTRRKAAKELFLPPNVAINTEKYDVILEIIWKIMFFVHYYCSNHFATHPADLSFLYNQWQILYSPDLVTRWSHSAKSGQTLRLLKSLLISVDFDANFKNIDHCCAAAYNLSDYKGWIKRSTRIRGTKLNSKLRIPNLWNRNAYCMQDYLFPHSELGYPLAECGVTIH